MVVLCSALFGDRFVPRDDLIAVSLSNVNPQNHLGMALCNFTRIERSEQWANWSGLTPSVGRLIEALDANVWPSPRRSARRSAACATIFICRSVCRTVRWGMLGRSWRHAMRRRAGQSGHALHHGGRAVRPGAEYRSGAHCGCGNAITRGRHRRVLRAVRQGFRAENDLLPPLAFEGLSMEALAKLSRG